MVEEADSRRDVRSAAAVECERDPERRLGARPDERRLASRGGPGSAPSARRRMSFSVGRRSVILMPWGNRRTTMPCASRRSPRSSSVRSQTKLPGRRRNVEAGARRAPRAPARAPRSRRRRRIAGRGALPRRSGPPGARSVPAPAAPRARPPSPVPRPRSRPAAPRSRTPSTSCGGRSGSGTRRATGRPTRRRTRRTPRRRRLLRPGGVARARRARRPASPLPSGSPGCSARAGSRRRARATGSAPLSSVAMR